jgi:hypothetical protein
MESNRAIRSFVAICAIAIFAACGGGGGGGGSISPSTGSGASSGSSSAATTAAKEQSVASSALSVSGNSLDVDQFGATGSIGIQAIQRALASRNGTVSATATPSCHNGVEFSQSGSNGSYMQTIEFFYDSACTQPRKEITLNITFSTSTGTFTGTEELWDTSGNVVDYKTDTGTFDFSGQQVTQVSVQRTVAAAPSATPFAENGFTCIFNSGQAVDCGNGIVATINNPQLDPHIWQNMGPSPSPSASPTSPTPSPTPYEIGFTGTVTGTQTTPSPSPSASPSSAPSWGGWNPQSFDLQFTVAGTGYMGATQSMTIAPATAPAWTMTGGTQVTTLSGTATIGFGQDATMSTANITLDDTADGLTITLTSVGNRGGLSGNVTNSSGQTVATVTVDANGDGVINYTTGATAQIRDWVILSS